MEIEKRSTIVITDVPGVGHLSRDGDEIDFVLSEQIFTPDAIRAIRDALTAVLDEAPEANMAGPWNHLSEIPESVKKVYDMDEDSLPRLSDGTWDTDGQTYNSWSRKYGPFRLER